jgi:hypothetical protein
MYNATVDTLTREDIAPQVVDTVLRENELTLKLFTNTKEFKAATIDFPVKYQKGTATTSFAGFDTLGTSFTDTRVLMKYNPRFNASNVALASTDIMANNTAAKVLELTEVEMISRAQDLADSIGTQFYSDGTNNANKDFLGLSVIVDDTASIGGLSRSTYATLASTKTSASGGLLSLYKMRTLSNAISDASVVPTDVFTDRPTWALYETLLQPQEKIYKEVNFAPDFKGYTGFQTLMFAGMPIIPDRKCTSGYMYMLNTKFLNFYALNAAKSDAASGGYAAKPIMVGNKLFSGSPYDKAKNEKVSGPRATDNMGFFWTGWIKSTNQFAYNSQIIVGGNVVTDNPRRHGVIYSINGV